jgi:hypothetical protein
MKLFRSNRPHCNIVESNTIASVLEHANKSGTMVIFDIDNTLLHTNQELGSDAWAYWFVKQKLKEGLRPQQALDYMFDLFKHIHSHIDVYPVEEQSVGIVKQLKDLDIPTICLTGRQASMIDVTKEQIKNTGFVLNCPQGLNKSITLKMSHPVEMADGIICGGMNDKGNVLEELFEKLKFPLPESIVFVDDRKACVESVSKKCSDNNIACIGLRYGYMDPITDKFDGQKAEQQLVELLKRYDFSR